MQIYFFMDANNRGEFLFAFLDLVFSKTKKAPAGGHPASNRGCNFYSGVDLGSIWAPSQIGLGSNSDQSGIQFGSVWAPFRIGLGSIPDRSGAHSGSVWATYRIDPGSIWETLGSVWGQFGSARDPGGPSGAQVC